MLIFDKPIVTVDFRDNHDLSVFICWDPERINGPAEEWSEVRALFEQDVRFLKLRTSVLWGISSAIDIIKSVDGTRQKHIASLRNTLSEWKSLHEQTVSDNFVPISQVSTKNGVRLDFFLTIFVFLEHSHVAATL